MSYASDIVLNGGLWSTSVHIDGQPDKSSAKTNMLAVGPDVFETMRIPLLNGRTLRPSTHARYLTSRLLIKPLSIAT